MYCNRPLHIFVMNIMNMAKQKPFQIRDLPEDVNDILINEMIEKTKLTKRPVSKTQAALTLIRKGAKCDKTN